jgi:hypothetical protein
VDVISPAPRDLWQQAVAADPHALADHTPAWTDAICSEAWRDASRAYVLPDGFPVVLPMVRRPGPAGWAVSLPPGWGFGGLVGARARDVDVTQQVAADLQGLGLPVLRLRPPPQDASAWSGCGGSRIPRRAHVLDRRPGPEQLFTNLRRSVRRSVRRCQDSAVEVRVGSDEAALQAYHQLWLLSVDRWAKRQGEPLVLARRRAVLRDPPTRMAALAQHLGEDLRIWVAYADGLPVAANVLVMGRSAHATRAASDTERAPAGIAQYLDWLGVQESSARGCSWLHLGESGTSSSLAFYKEGLGAVAHDYAELRFERLPVTGADALARRTVKKLIGFRG